MAKIVGKPNVDDVKRVAVAALVAALDDGKDTARKNPRLTGMRAVAAGAVLYTAGKAAFSGRRFINERLNQNDGEAPDEDEAYEDDEEFEDDEEPVAEEDEDFEEDEEEEPVAEEDEDFEEDEEEEPVAEEDEDFEEDEEEEEPVAEEDEDFEEDRGGRGGARRRGGRGLRGGGRGRRGAQRRVRAACPSRRGERSPRTDLPTGRASRDARGATLIHGLSRRRRAGALSPRGRGRAAAARLVHRLPARAAQGRDLARARQEPLFHPYATAQATRAARPAQQTTET